MSTEKKKNICHKIMQEDHIKKATVPLNMPKIVFLILTYSRTSTISEQ